jgi:hypothetical protein
MKRNYLAFVLIYYQFLSAQEIKNSELLHEPAKLSNSETNSLLDSLSLRKLNSLFFNDNFNYSNRNTDTVHNNKSAEEKRLQNLLGSYADFKRKFLALEIKDYVTNLHLPKARGGTPQLLDPNFISSVGFLINSPISFFYYNLSKQEQTMRKLYAINAYAPNRRYIDSRYNREKVQLWTGLKDDELTKFVLFCNFDDSFLLNTSEYDLIDAVLKKLSDFKAFKEFNNSKID